MCEAGKNEVGWSRKESNNQTNKENRTETEPKLKMNQNLSNIEGARSVLFEGETKEVLSKMVVYLIERNVFLHESWCEWVAGTCEEDEDDEDDEKYSLETFKEEMIATAGASVDAFNDFVRTDPMGIVMQDREWMYEIVPSVTEGHVKGFVYIKTVKAKKD